MTRPFYCIFTAAFGSKIILKIRSIFYAVRQKRRLFFEQLAYFPYVVFASWQGPGLPQNRLNGNSILAPLNILFICIAMTIKPKLMAFSRVYFYTMSITVFELT